LRKEDRVHIRMYEMTRDETQWSYWIITWSHATAELGLALYPGGQRQL